LKSQAHVCHQQSSSQVEQKIKLVLGKSGHHRNTHTIVACSNRLPTRAATALSHKPAWSPSSPNRRSHRWTEEWGPDLFSLCSFRLGLWILIDLGFGSDVTDEVAAMMVLWNKVSLKGPLFGFGN
jgi:hypothetical protein